MTEPQTGVKLNEPLKKLHFLIDMQNFGALKVMEIGYEKFFFIWFLNIEKNTVLSPKL